MRIVCISDTHEAHKDLTLPEGDLLLHSGDFTFNGCFDAIRDFNHWLGTLPFKYRVVIPGNHDITMDKNHPYYSPEARGLMTNCHFLINEMVEIEGLKIYGSPVTPWFYDWAFNERRGNQIRKTWDLIPPDVDILVTHGPPLYILDDPHPGGHRSEKVGCWDLANVLGTYPPNAKRKIAPKLHVFGHIHGSGGEKLFKNDTLFVNASVLNEAYCYDNDGQLVCSECWNQCPTCTVLNDIKTLPEYGYCDCDKSCCYWKKLEGEADGHSGNDGVQG